MDKVLILVIDGCAPDYLSEAAAPQIHRLARRYGFLKRVQCALPSVTNVNHACILSGEWPERTRIVGNYLYNPATGEEGFLEERGYMQAPTILQRYRQAGGRTALLTVKGKVLGVYGEGADIGFTLQDPDLELVRRYHLSPPPTIQSVESSGWIVEAACRCIEIDHPELVYCTTNDGVFHHHAPGEPEATEQIAAIDRWIARIHEIDPERQIYITADHGMNRKTTILDLQRMADRAGLSIFCLKPLKDRYIENHLYQEGGMVYVYLKKPEERAAFLDFVRQLPQVEAVQTAAEAAASYHLPAGQIGDYVLYAAPDCAFGELESGEILHTDASRTHGSRYEREIPLAAIHPAAGPECYQYHLDIVRNLVL